jgi:hypothetical protein
MMLLKVARRTLLAAIVASAATIAFPSYAVADDPEEGQRYCYCNGYECGAPAPPNYQRWCCANFPYNCGCSFFVTGCGET